MLRTLSLTGSSTISQSINVADEDEVGESGSNGTNLSNLSASRRSTGVGYLSFGGAKKGEGNIKKGFKAARGSDYLILAAKEAFNHLQNTFTQAPIFQHFDLDWQIQIQTNVSDYAISRVLNHLTLDDLG